MNRIRNRHPMRSCSVLTCVVSALYAGASAVAGPPPDGPPGAEVQPPAHNQPPQKKPPPVLPKQGDLVYYLACRVDQDDPKDQKKDEKTEPIVVESRVQLASTTAPADLDQTLRLPAPWSTIRVKQFLPRATVEQMVVPHDGPDAKPALQMTIEGPKQTIQRWLLADDAERNRLVSVIGWWRYMAVEDRAQRDALFAQFEDELTREPMLVIHDTVTDAVVKLPAREGPVQTPENLGCRITIEKFFTHLAIDPATRAPVNRSKLRLNPAVRIQIERKGKTQQRWVYTRHPEMNTPASDAFPFEMRLDCPIDRKRKVPDFVLVSIGEGPLEVWARYQGKVSSEVLELGKKVDIAGSKYIFRIDRRVPRGRLLETYHSSDDPMAAPALKVLVNNPGKPPAPIWLPLGKKRRVQAESGALTLLFGPRPNALHEAHP